MNQLPPLPKQNEKKEADFGIKLRRWVEKTPALQTCSFEVKHTRGKKSFPLQEFKPKQEAYAHSIQSETGCLLRIIGTNGEPDYVFMKKEPAYVVIRYPDDFYIISAKDLSNEKKTSRSLSESRAKELSLTFPCL